MSGRRREELYRLPTGFPADDFWTRVAERADGCLVWRGTLRADGDGVYYWRPAPGERHRELSARRVAWMDAKGELRRRWKVYSACRTPGCVNPEHLASGPRDYEREGDEA